MQAVHATTQKSLGELRAILWMCKSYFLDGKYPKKRIAYDEKVNLQKV